MHSSRDDKGCVCANACVTSVGCSSFLSGRFISPNCPAEQQRALIYLAFRRVRQNWITLKFTHLLRDE